MFIFLKNKCYLLLFQEVLVLVELFQDEGLSFPLLFQELVELLFWIGFGDFEGLSSGVEELSLCVLAQDGDKVELGDLVFQVLGVLEVVFQDFVGEFTLLGVLDLFQELVGGLLSLCSDGRGLEDLVFQVLTEVAGVLLLLDVFQKLVEVFGDLFHSLELALLELEFQLDAEGFI